MANRRRKTSNIQNGFDTDTRHDILSHGGPSEDKDGCLSSFKAGDVSWVMGYKKGSDFKSWQFDFELGASTFLSSRVYRDKTERANMYAYALLKAARVAENNEMHRHIQLLIKSGHKTEDLLQQLRLKYDVGAELEQFDACERLFKFKRNGISLTEALKLLNDRNLECVHAGYDPDDGTLAKIYEMLLEQSERPMFRMYLHTSISFFRRDRSSESATCNGTVRT